MKICPHCGNAIKNDLAKFCGKCGTKQPEIAPVIEPEQEPETLSVEDEDFVEAEQLSVATPPPSFEGEGMSAPPPIPAVEDVSCTTPPPVPSELLEQAEYASQDMNGETEFDEEEDIYSSAQYEEEKKLGCGAIAGIILGVLVAIIFIVGILYCIVPVLSNRSRLRSATHTIKAGNKARRSWQEDEFLGMLWQTP